VVLDVLAVTAYRRRFGLGSATSSMPLSAGVWKVRGCGRRLPVKYTHNAFDFSTFGNTPIFFPFPGRVQKSMASYA